MTASPEQMAALPIHELARTFPEMGETELRELATDIHNNGLLEPITTYQGQVLDGRNRIKAAKVCGYAFKAADFVELDAKKDPLAFVISKNIKRRHLTAEQKRNLLATLIKLDPSKSNRQIAAEAKVSHHTVGGVRGELEATGQTAQLETTTGKDGKKRKTGKEKKTKPPATRYTALQEQMIDVLQEFTSVEHAREYVDKTKARLDQTIENWKPQQAEAA